MKIDLLLFGDRAEITWSLGEIHRLDYTVESASNFVANHIDVTTADAWFFGDAQLGLPNEKLILARLLSRIDVWHAGLRLGMSGLPQILDYASPTSVFTRDPDPCIEASSWRLSLRSCLVRTQVIRELGFIHPNFISMDAASLELGYRWLHRGVLLRHTPELLNSADHQDPISLGTEDEVLFLHLTHERSIKYWALMRSVMTGYARPLRAIKAVRSTSTITIPETRPYSPNQANLYATDLPREDFNVTVLIPTVDRYPYLRTVLEQLRSQTIQPSEIIIVDQTEYAQRDTVIAKDFRDLPLKIIYHDSPGQCTSRNAGLNASKGEYVLFLDDDVEFDPAYIEGHLRNLHCFVCDASSGKTNEVGATTTAGLFQWTGISSIFPTGNTLIRKQVLYQSGLFDTAYNHGQTADGDLGMRIYLSGALMIYNPQINVLHHRAPRGGLRKHKARVITYSSSRSRLMHRRLPHITEIYRMKRYFSSSQVREALWLYVAGTFSVRGGITRKLLKYLMATCLLPNTVWTLRQRLKKADEMLKHYPDISVLMK